MRRRSAVGSPHCSRRHGIFRSISGPGFFRPKRNRRHFRLTKPCGRCANRVIADVMSMPAWPAARPRACRFSRPYRERRDRGRVRRPGVIGVGVVVSLGGRPRRRRRGGGGRASVSICDQPDPLRQKPLVLGLAFLSACFFAALSAWTAAAPVLFVPATALAGLIAGLMSPYRKRALGLGMTGMLAFVFAVGIAHDPSAAIWRYLLPAGRRRRARLCALCARGLQPARRPGMRRLLIAEAMRGFARYLRAKAELYDPRKDEVVAFRALIDAHAELVERLQAARVTRLACAPPGSQSAATAPDRHAHRAARCVRDRAFERCRYRGAAPVAPSPSAAPPRHAHRAHRKRCRTPDPPTPRTRRGPIPNRATAMRRGDPVSSTPRSTGLPARHRGRSARKKPHAVAAFRATANKLADADRHVAELARAIDPGHAAVRDRAHARPRGVSRVRTASATWAGQWSCSAPALRYALRLSLAMTAGLLVTLAFPAFTHGSWVLLTIALIMRANYSVTAQRRRDRVTGTLIGCVLAALLVHWAPTRHAARGHWLLGVGVSAMPMRWCAIASRRSLPSVTVRAAAAAFPEARLAHPEFTERIVDTLIGAGISYVSALRPAELGASRPAEHGRRAACRRCPASPRPRSPAIASCASRYSPCAQARARRGGGLSGAIRRLADEPNTDRAALDALNRLLAANYLFASELTSMPVLMRLREGRTRSRRAAMRSIAATYARGLIDVADQSGAWPNRSSPISTGAVLPRSNPTRRQACSSAASPISNVPRTRVALACCRAT